jgi:hypothetical protein
MWTTLKWITRALEAVLILALILYVEEDLRGAHEWVAAERQLQAKGESLDLRQLIPPGKPEDDLSKVPIFAELYAELRRDPGVPATPPARIRRLEISFRKEISHAADESPKLSSYTQGQPLNLPAWQKYYFSIPDAHLTPSSNTPAQDVLKVLSQFDPEMSEIDQALSNPNAYWPVDYDFPTYTALGGATRMIKIAKILQLKAIAHLENHETDLAEKDYLFSFRLDRPQMRGWSEVHYLVIEGVRNIDDSILWEGLRRHAWSDAQLREMESALASEDMLALAVKTLRAERAARLQDTLLIQHLDLKTAAKYQLDVSGDITWLIPGGWWDRARAIYSLGTQASIEAIDPAREILNSQTFDSQFPKKEEPPWYAYYIPALPTLSFGSSSIGQRIAKAESYRRLARLACRLEEYRIAHGQYPEVLPALPDLPPHLDQEVCSELPLRYEPKGDGYQLYSIGWDQKDDGATRTRRVPDKNGVMQQEDADWVWPSP